MLTDVLTRFARVSCMNIDVDVLLGSVVSYLPNISLSPNVTSPFFLHRRGLLLVLGPWVFETSHSTGYEPGARLGVLVLHPLFSLTLSVV
jgi:hypothetical protein